jgi:tetratricopeptide (TPR) repeat protein
VTFLATLTFITATALAQTPPVGDQAPLPESQPTQIEELFQQQRWTEVVAAAETVSPRDANVDYYYGSALAQLGRLDEARGAFLAGRHSRQRDPRFPIELGGVAFKQKRYAEAARWLRRGLRLAPDDPYANEFLATIYFLQGNLEAAVKRWNRIEKPRIANLQVQPDLRVDPGLLDRAFTFAPAELLRLPDLETTETRVAGLGIFPSHSIRLNAKDDGTFDASFRAQERDGWGNGKWGALLSTFRGVFYETIYPDYSNIGGSATNISALARWDSQKRRLLTSLSGPLANDPKYRYQIGVDLREENWMLRPSSQDTAPVNGALTLGREAVNAGITSFASGSWGWSAGVEISHRSYASIVEGPQLPAAVLLRGYGLKQTATLSRELWRAPERHFESSANVSSEAGTIWSAPSHSFEKLQASVIANWKPQFSGDDYATHEQFRAGKTFGSVPFDDLFMLGLERDNDLSMRAHVGTFNGQKGSAPLGRNYLLFNSEMDKNIYGNGLIGVKLSPFVDTGKITDPLAGLGSQQWLWDIGIQIKVRILGVGATFTYGKDLRTGNNALYFTAAH